jgi:Bacterial CdiA-CT RNAse A domain
MQYSRASSFPDLDAAQRFTQRAVDANRARITAWLREGTAARLAVCAYFHHEFTGRLLPLGALYAGQEREPTPVRGVRVVLVRDAQAANGFTVLAGYPTEN